ncbi:MAG: hypothetical protein KA297_21570 [Kofleriaceae bacterium]|nr:hypothetical protein [Kofleriaceae bacterium]MBP6837229.1 hypothetical protein [Kofleriaceae bacterium]
MQTNTCLRVNSTLAALALLSLAGLGASACMAEDDGPIELADLDLGAGIPEDALTGTARILTPDGELEVGYDIVDGRAIVEGDIDLGPVEALRAKTADHANASLLYDRWTGGKIKYIPPSFNQAAINGAIAAIEAATQLDFVPVTTPMLYEDLLFFTQSSDSGVSSSQVGRQGGWQQVKIWPTHGQSVVIHELLHAAGLWHEQSRSDRNNHVIVNLVCVPPSRWHNFDIKAPLVGFPFGGFDFNSIMLYGSSAFSIFPGCNSMVRKSNGATFSGNSSMSAGDVAAINAMF